MTKKRFKLIYINKQNISANLYDNGIFIGSIEHGEKLIVEVLNQLSNENEQLKQQLSKQGTQIDFLKDENTHMRNVLKENKQLKQSIKEVVELLSEEVDVFSEKATKHDIIAYRELNQLDNKDAYYMATATKKAIKILKGCLND